MSLQMWDVWKTVQSVSQSQKTPEDPHRWISLQMWGVWETVQSVSQSQKTPEDPHRWMSLQMWGVWETVQAVRPSQKTHEDPHRWMSLQMWGVWETVQSVRWSEQTCENPQVNMLNASTMSTAVSNVEYPGHSGNFSRHKLAAMWNDITSTCSMLAYTVYNDV